jgi:hypothetical protein
LLLRCIGFASSWKKDVGCLVASSYGTHACPHLMQVALYARPLSGMQVWPLQDPALRTPTLDLPRRRVPGCGVPHHISKPSFQTWRQRLNLVPGISPSPHSCVMFAVAAPLLTPLTAPALLFTLAPHNAYIAQLLWLCVVHHYVVHRVSDVDQHQ